MVLLQHWISVQTVQLALPFPSAILEMASSVTEHSRITDATSRQLISKTALSIMTACNIGAHRQIQKKNNLLTCLSTN